MDDVFNLRFTCKQIRDVTLQPFLKKMWEIKQNQIEERFLENRAKMVQAWTKAKSKIDRKSQLVLKEDTWTSTLIKAVKENLVLSRKLIQRGEYDQQKLEKFNFKEAKFVNLTKIHGFGCWAFANKEKSEEGLLIVPRCKGDAYLCETENRWVQVLVVEVFYFKWSDRVADSLCCMEEEYFRDSRYLPLYGEYSKLTRAMDKINMAAFAWNTWGEVNHQGTTWPHAFERLWLPKVICHHNRSPSPNISGGGFVVTQPC